jgi:hypothetical protein
MSSNIHSNAKVTENIAHQKKIRVGAVRLTDPKVEIFNSCI